MHQKDPMATGDAKQRSVGWGGISNQADTVEEVGFDQEASIEHRVRSPGLESTGKEEERPVSQHLKARN